MKKFKLISILFSFSCIFLNAQSGCFEIESILVNSCSFGNEEGRNEMLRFRVGNTPLSTNDMTVAWANTNLPWNGLIQDASTAQATAAFNSEIVSCGLLKEPTNGILPANSRVLLITSNEVSTTVGFFEQLGDTLYVIYANDNTIAGHFLNYLPNPSPNIQTTVISFGSIAGCSDQVSYFRTQLITTASNIGDEDGATVNFTNNGIPAYSNIGCFISPLQTASITALPTICFGTATSITFTGTPYAVVTYTVNGGSDQTITLNGSGLANLSTGLLYENTMYELLNISSSDSPVCTQSFSGSALVTVSPIPTASYTGTTTICSNQTTAVVLSSSFSGTTYAWTVLQTGVLGASNGSGSSIAQTLTNDGSVSGLVVYTVTPTTNGCTGTTTTIPVTVNPLPVANSSGTSPICSGPVLATANSPSIQLISNLGAGTTFNWTGSDGISGSSNIISYSIPNNLCTDRTILYTVTPTFNGCVGSAISIPLTVHPNPIAAFTVSASTISQNSTVTVTFTGSACPTSNYFWTWPAGSIVIGSGAGPYSVTFPNSGNYSIDLSLSNPGGFCAAQTFSLPISVSASATATASAGSDVTICSGSTINLAGIIGGNATSATWSAPSGTFSNVNSLTSTYTPSISSGVVQLTLTTNDPDGAGPNSPAVSSLNVTVNLAASISAGANQTICTGNTASLSGFFAGSASLATWSATSGTFNNVNLNNAIFTPPANASGSYLLTYTSNDPAGVCPAVSSIPP